MPRIALHLQNGRTFTVVAEGLSEENKYVQRILRNGRPYRRRTISHEDILKGGELRFVMGSRPCDK